MSSRVSSNYRAARTIGTTTPHWKMIGGLTLASAIALLLFCLPFMILSLFW